MDGNFVDNNINDIIRSAESLPAIAKKEDGAPKNKGATELSKSGNYEKFALRIKFNNPLDPHSVTKDNAVLSDGKRRVKTNVIYDGQKKSIIISPTIKYLKNRLYVLQVSGRIMSEGGRSLRSNKFFAFRHDGNRLSFYKNFDAKVDKAPDTLIIEKNYFLPVMFAVSSLVLVISYLAGNKLGIGIGTVMVLIATAFAFLDSISDIGKSHKEYVYGARLYNQGFYGDAIECFERALHYNPDNVFAKYGLDAAIVKENS